MPTWTELERTALRLAIGNGVTSVSYSNRTVTYRSLADMLAILALMDADLDGPPEGPVSYRLAATRKGV